jgi:hypothetical protein
MPNAPPEEEDSSDSERVTRAGLAPGGLAIRAPPRHPPTLNLT